MTAVVFSAFAGEIPRVSSRLLPPNAAKEAVNTLLSSGEITAMRADTRIITQAGLATVFRGIYNGGDVWMQFTDEVTVSPLPLPPEVEPRYFITSPAYEPRFCLFSAPTSYYTMGVPKPKTKPTVTPSGGVGAAVTRAYVYSFFNALGEESAPSPVSTVTTGKVDDTWAITNMDAFPPNSGTVSGSVLVPGETTFTDTAKHFLRVGEHVTITSVKKTVIRVVSDLVYVVAGEMAGAGQTWARDAPWHTTGMKRRLYRSSGTNATYQLVHDDVGTSYNDTILDADILGDELISSSWEIPPVRLNGVIALPNGAMVGFVGNQLRYSEPYQAFAWPNSYAYGANYDIVGIAAYGVTVVVCTKANPYIADGVEPSSVTLQRVDQNLPCLSSRTIISIGDGVLFATNAGMAYVGVAGANIWTQALFSPEDWAKLEPGTMMAAYSNGRVFIAFNEIGHSSGIYVIQPNDAQASLVRISSVANGLYADVSSGNLYFVRADGVYHWNSAPDEFVSYSWRSKDLQLPKPVNFSVCKIDFKATADDDDEAAAQATYADVLADNQDIIDNGDLLAAYNEFSINETEYNADNLAELPSIELNTLYFTLFADGVAVFTKQVTSQAAFRLPSGYKSDVYAVQVTGTMRVLAIRLAENPLGLQAL